MDIRKLIERLKQRSSWAGGGVLVSVLAIAIGPELAQQIGTAAAALIGLYEVVRNEREG